MKEHSPLHQPALHESSFRHVTGEALYVDDLPPPRGMLHGYVLASKLSRARIKRIDVTDARALPGVEAVLTAADVPGDNDVAPIAHDEPLLAAEEIHTAGQAIALIVAVSPARGREAASLIDLELEELPPLLDLEEAIEQGSFLDPGPHVIERGDVDAALEAADLRLQGTVETPGQDHFYLETQVALAVPEEETLRVHSSTQHPTEAQAKIASLLGVARQEVVVEVPRMGGAFGGKESQATHFAAFAALGAHVTGRPVKICLDRDQDMRQTGKRHPALGTYDAGFDSEGNLQALVVEVFIDGGWSADLSKPILDRCLFHLDNAYFVPNLRFKGRIARTNHASNTAMRGFGGPQGMVIVETVLNRAAHRLSRDPLELRQQNFYGASPCDMTPYGQVVSDCPLDELTERLVKSSAYHERKQAIALANNKEHFLRRGISFQPIKFGISFTNAILNHAGALVLIYGDGTVQVNHGGTEMGQGLHTKMRAIAAHDLGVPIESVRVMTTATDKVPNTSATAASSGSDLNGEAIHYACQVLRERLEPFAKEALSADADQMLWSNGMIRWKSREGREDREVPFTKVVKTAHLAGTSLAATGYYRTPGIHYDATKGRGKPFHYYAYGASVIEVEVNGLTGEHRLLRVDILHDVGASLLPTIDRGQIEGAFIQGYGWLTSEELVWDSQGNLQTHSPSTYKIPAAGTTPSDFRVALLGRTPKEAAIFGSKAVGEPPFMLAIGTLTALQEAVGSFGSGEEVSLSLPCTPESVLRAVTDVRKRQIR